MLVPAISYAKSQGAMEGLGVGRESRGGGSKVRRSTNPSTVDGL